MVFASCPLPANADSDVSHIHPPTLQFDYATAWSVNSHWMLIYVFREINDFYQCAWIEKENKEKKFCLFFLFVFLSLFGLMIMILIFAFLFIQNHDNLNLFLFSNRQLKSEYRGFLVPCSNKRYCSTQSKPDCFGVQDINSWFYYNPWISGVLFV